MELRNLRVESGTTKEVDQPNPPRPRLLEPLENVSHLETMLFDDRASLYSLESDLSLAFVEEEALVGAVGNEAED